jgi:hypothetical protein
VAQSTVLKATKEAELCGAGAELIFNAAALF